MEIRIDRGYKSYDVTDADGTVLGTVRLNLADRPELHRGKSGAVHDVRNALPSYRGGLQTGRPRVSTGTDSRRVRE